MTVYNLSPLTSITVDINTIGVRRVTLRNPDWHTSKVVLVTEYSRNVSTQEILADIAREIKFYEFTKGSLHS